MKRIEVLDVLRGVAIMGTLGTNIWIFTSPNGPADLLGTSSGAVETFLRFLANGKFLGLLTLLFGVGLELQYQSSKRRGTPWPGWYLWRAGLLFIEGLLHYFLIFEFDVLMGYAITSLIVAYLIGRSAGSVRRWMIGMGSLHVTVVLLGTLGMLTETTSLNGESTDLFTHGTWLDQVISRFDLLAVYRMEAVFIIPMGTVLFLLGSRLMRAGVFETSERGAKLRTKLMIGGLGVALPLNLVTAYADPGWFLVDRYLLPPMVALGLLGLITTVVAKMRETPGLVRRSVTNVGRSALTSYVFQNLAAAVLCYGWGFGLAARFADFRPWWVIGAWAGICLMFMVLTSLWLRRFDRGPLELVWQWAYQLPQRGRAQVTGSAVQGAPSQTSENRPYAKK
ncbi:DUF418 domain-containing protein [Streptosporangium soli]|nr:DUF418 domain-containing protein [Streptosporangium sp. KLBMP 9127]